MATECKKENWNERNQVTKLIFSRLVTGSNKNLVNNNLEEMINSAHIDTWDYFLENKHRESIRVLYSLANMGDTQHLRLEYTFWKIRGNTTNTLKCPQ